MKQALHPLVQADIEVGFLIQGHDFTWKHEVAAKDEGEVNEEEEDVECVPDALEILGCAHMVPLANLVPEIAQYKVPSDQSRNEDGPHELIY